MYRLSIVWLLLVPCFLFASEKPDVFQMSLEELLSLRVSSSASLTKSERARTPATVTHISREMIRYSGARNLDELLEMYVPNFQRLRQAAGPRFGIRGIISDIDDKTLLLVNGRVMNHKNIYGAISERYLPLLGDIDSIEVIRGPGSAIYGPGAINGVISITTLSATSFEGVEVSVAQGIVEEYSLAEVRWGRRFSEDWGIFAYFGLDDYTGASPEDSPLVYSKDGTFFSAGEKITENLTEDNAADDGAPHHKAHLNVQYKGFDFWVHSTRGSIEHVGTRHHIERYGSFTNSNRSLTYQQFTATAKQRLPLSDQLMMTLSGSYDLFDIVMNVDNLPKGGYENSNAVREDEFNLKQLLDWDISPAHSVAVGFEFSYERFGRDAEWLTDESGHAGSSGDQWDTRTYSILSEYQWNPHRTLTFFVDGRAEKHTYTDWMYSPRLAGVYMPTDKHQFKVLYNRGLRKSEDRQLRAAALQNQNPDIEKIDLVELRYDGQWTDHLNGGLSLFQFNHDVLGFLQSIGERDVGEVTCYGVEAEVGYKGGRNQLTLSHSYTKMIDFKYEGSRTQVITAEPYGYGDDLANWANHQSKLNWHCKLAKKWRMNSSMVIYWGYPGAEDYTRFNNAAQMPGHVNLNYSQSDGRTDAFDPSVFLRAGLHYQASEHARLSLNLYNILGWVDEDLNKRNYYGRMAGYRLEAPAASVGLDMRF